MRRRPNGRLSPTERRALLEEASRLIGTPTDRLHKGEKQSND